MPGYYTDALADTICNFLKTGLANFIVGLYNAGELTPSIGTTLDEVEAAECDFSGYTRQPVTSWTGAFNYPAGGSFIQSPTLTWLGDSTLPFVGGTIGGWFLVNSAETLLFAVASLPNTYPIARQDDIFQMVARLPQGVPTGL